MKTCTGTSTIDTILFNTYVVVVVVILFCFFFGGGGGCETLLFNLNQFKKRPHDRRTRNFLLFALNYDLADQGLTSFENIPKEINTF